MAVQSIRPFPNIVTQVDLYISLKQHIAIPAVKQMRKHAYQLLEKASYGELAEMNAAC